LEGLLTQCRKDSTHISELGSQLVSETGKNILAISICETGPVLYISLSLLLLDRIRILPDLVAGHIPYHGLILFTVLVAGTVLEHLAFTV
jgi:hypothetical protein